MQPSTKLKQKSIIWNDNLKPRVGTVVSFNGAYYSNTSGINSDVSDQQNWFPIKGREPIELNKVASDITEITDDFIILLNDPGVPDYPNSMAVYIDVNGDNTDVQFIQPVLYNPITKVIRGMISPDDYPNQKVKILLS